MNTKAWVIIAAPILVAGACAWLGFSAFNERLPSDPPISFPVVAAGVGLEIVSMLLAFIAARAFVLKNIAAARKVALVCFMAFAIGSSLVQQGLLYGNDFGKHRILRNSER